VLLKNKVAAISGAAGLRGIGFATAKLFAEQGARVAILDIDAAAAETAASSLGGGHLGLRCDVSKKAECESAIKEVIAKTGQLDILINNAGITQALNVWDIDDDSWNRMLDVNLRGVLYLSQAAIPHMREKKAGSIVCTASGAVHSGGGFVGTAHYCASKGGVIALGRAMARELGPFGIRVNCIAPGLIQTDINAGKISDDKIEDFKRRTPLRRLGKPQDIANAFLYLASDMSDYVTEQVVDVNGGIFMN